jgi:hypothetical protein
MTIILHSVLYPAAVAQTKYLTINQGVAYINGKLFLSGTKFDYTILDSWTVSILLAAVPGKKTANLY